MSVRGSYWGHTHEPISIMIADSISFRELRQKFCYPRGGVKRVEKIRCARSDCYRGGNG